MTMATVRKFHVILADGSERDVTGKDAKVGISRVSNQRWECGDRYLRGGSVGNVRT